jgi:hypothetical protein
VKWVLSVLAALGLAIGSGWLVAQAYFLTVEGEAATAAVELPAPSTAKAPGPDEPVPELPAPLPVFAVAGGVRLRLPTVRPVALAYHEASMPRRIALQPFGSCVKCRNRWKFRPPRIGPSDLEYMVMDTRGRPAPATSAVDVVVRRRDRIRSPVTGTVWRFRRYRLYGRYPDARVAIVPDGRPDRLVVLIHLQEVRVRSGDRVVASQTVLGRARRFPFESQVDRYVRGTHPHVHLEVKRPPARRA